MKLENTTLKGRQAAICVLLCLAGLLVITVLAPRKAVGQEAPFAVKGTAASPTAANVPSDVELTSMSPVAVLPSASYATGGKGMRNQGAGAIVISGAKPPIKAALIYSGRPSPKVRPLPRINPLLSSDCSLRPRPRRGQRGWDGGRVGGPCWTGTTITVFRGTI